MSLVEWIQYVNESWPSPSKIPGEELTILTDYEMIEIDCRATWLEDTMFWVKHQLSHERGDSKFRRSGASNSKCKV